MAHCERCGVWFERGADEYWKKLCLSCFKKKKREEGEWEEPRPWNQRWHQAQQPRYIQGPGALVTDEDIKRYLPHLIRLCHPDKHDNSNVSNSVTKWLLQLKAKVKEQ